MTIREVLGIWMLLRRQQLLGVILFASGALAYDGCVAPTACLRHSDCAADLMCIRGLCAVVVTDTGDGGLDASVSGSAGVAAAGQVGSTVTGSATANVAPPASGGDGGSATSEIAEGGTEVVPAGG